MTDTIVACRCPICGAHIPSNHLMCPEHWAMVPPEMRPSVHAAYRRYTARRSTLEELRAKQQKAIDAVHAELARMSEAPDERIDTNLGMRPSWTIGEPGDRYMGLIKELGTDARLWRCSTRHPNGHASRGEALACAKGRIKQEESRRAAAR